MSDRLTLATSTGLPFLAVAFHFGTGLIALAAGFIAVAMRKGGTWHRRSGTIFVYAMIATAIAVVGISLFEGKSPGGGVFIAYLIVTAYTAVKPLPASGRRVDIALMLLALTFAAATYNSGLTALGRPGNQINGVPAGMMFFLGTIAFLAAIGDIRMIRADGIQGTRRLARHLWRMCFGLFIASGSFAAQLARMKYLPESLRSFPMIILLGGSPLVVLLYWMWRVRLKQNLRGLMTAKPIAARRLA